MAHFLQRPRPRKQVTNTGMHRRRNTIIAFVVTLVLIVGLGAYSVHEYSKRPHNSGHCDLSSHLSGAAGSPAAAVVVRKPVLAVRVPPARPQPIRAQRRRVTTQLPRGPPSFARQFKVVYLT